MSSTSCETHIVNIINGAAPSSSSEIDHVVNLSENLKNSLFLNPEYADVYLVVEGIKFPAHKIILAARSEYFRALLFGGMRESSQEEVELKGATTAAFKVLLKYVYTGRLSLTELKEDVTLDVLG
jgi:BTB/POZ domain-containing protein 9